MFKHVQCTICKLFHIFSTWPWWLWLRDIFPWRSFCVFSWCPARSNGPCSVAAFGRNCGRNLTKTWRNLNLFRLKYGYVWIDVIFKWVDSLFKTLFRQLFPPDRFVQRPNVSWMSLWPETPDSTSILLQKSGWKKSADCTESVYQATASLATARVRESGMPVVTCLIKNIKEFTTVQPNEQKKQLSAQSQVAILLNAHHSLARTHPLHIG